MAAIEAKFEELTERDDVAVIIINQWVARPQLPAVSVAALR